MGDSWGEQGMIEKFVSEEEPKFDFMRAPQLLLAIGQLGWTREYLMKKAGVGRGFVDGLASGGPGRVSGIERLAQAMGLPFDWLVAETDEDLKIVEREVWDTFTTSTPSTTVALILGVLDFAEQNPEAAKFLTRVIRSTMEDMAKVFPYSAASQSLREAKQNTEKLSKCIRHKCE